MSLVFISYSRLDKDFVNKLRNDLEYHGIEVWMDDKIKAGMTWDESIQKSIKECRYFILVVSADSSKSSNVLDELTLARDENKEILPVIKEECDIPYRLRRFNYSDLSENYHSGLSVLLKRLKGSFVPYEDSNGPLPSDNLILLSCDFMREIIRRKKIIFGLMISFAMLFSYSSILIDLSYIFVFAFSFFWSFLTYFILDYSKQSGEVKGSCVVGRYDRFFIPSKIKFLE